MPHPFDSVEVTPEGHAKIEALRNGFHVLACVAESLRMAPAAGRGLAPYETEQFRLKLEEAQMWGVKALSRLNMQTSAPLDC